MNLKKFVLEGNPVCRKEAVIVGDHFRITMLTTALIRFEYSEDGGFEDRATQMVCNRDFPVPEFRVSDGGEELHIYTKDLEIHYDRQKFSPSGLMIRVAGGKASERVWHYGDEPKDLLGTARTLDEADGEIPLSHGIMSRNGFSVLDDSHTMAMGEDGMVEPRQGNRADFYFFGYGHRYVECLQDFYRLCGKTPLLPRYTFGNWWSRYHKYTETEYKELVERFEKEEVPFSVAVVDMDWHLVEDVPPVYGSGWTGYTWNKKFFPNPPEFMDWLHKHGYKITLNVHPADGVRAYEEAYPRVAEKMGIDPASKEPVLFDMTDPKFIETYFEELHHPMEEEGVDFWWLDWQQGTVTKVPGLDPLWMLNHYHHFDLTRTGKRGVMLSRYSGLGSHRYPIGFSGDTHVTWNALQYQPYFTATASNVGYTWWSHDIGGHMNGIKDNELYVRWIQFGVFSPINRLHSNSNPFCGKEPWRYPKPYDDLARESLRLRHRLLPYIYTMNAQCHEKMVPVVVPAYYYYPMEEGSYVCRNEYFFGTELLVQPMVHPTDHETGYTTEKSWIPAGNWYDFDNGAVRHGGPKGHYTTISRPIDRQGVLAKAGAIVPMAPDTGDNCIDNPETLEILVFPGQDNTYTLFEDGGEGFDYENGVCLRTEISLSWKDEAVTLEVRPSGDLSVVPKKRRYVLRLRGFAKIELTASSEAMESEYDSETRTLTLTTELLEAGRSVSVTLPGADDCTAKESREKLNERVFEFLDQVQGSIVKKKNVYQYFAGDYTKEEILASLTGLELPESWKAVLTEMLIG